MTLSDISIKNSVFAWMLMAALILFGYIAFRDLGVSEMPDVDFPVVTVSTTYEGAAPEVVDVDVVDLIEQSVMTVQGIKSISSTARQGESTTTIEFELGRDIDAAVQDIQSKIGQVQKVLPKEMDPPIVNKTNPEDQPIMWLSLSSETHATRDIMEYARDQVRDKIQTVNGVGEVILGGFIQPTLRVFIQPEKLSAYDLTVKDVLDAIEAEHVETPAGRIETATKEYNLRLMGEARTPEDFGKILIHKRGGQPMYRSVPLSEVATIVKGLDEIRRISRTNGQSSIGMGIKKQRGSNAVEVANQVKARLKALETTLAPGYKIQINFDSTEFIKHTVGEMKLDLVLAAVLTAVVCLFFLASWSSTANVLMAIPTSIVGTFLFLKFFGFTLNTFTLLGLILAIGIVVDDAIMVLENIVRHREMGKSAIRAARDGAREITPAAIATTLSIIAIFIPVVFMKGIIGEFFFQFGITMAVAVSLSLLEALTLTPMRASIMTGRGHEDNAFSRGVHAFFSRLAEIYRGSLAACLRHRVIVLVLASLVLGVSFFTLTGVRKEFIPAQDQSMFLVRFQTPLGSSITYTDEHLRQAEAIIAAEPAVARSFVAVGGFGGGDVNTAMAFVSLKAPKERPIDKVLGHRLTQAELIARFRESFKSVPNLIAIVQDLSTRGFSPDRGFPIEFTIRGPDWQTLTSLAPTVLEAMKKEPDFVDIDTDYKTGQPEIQLSPKRDAAALRGVSVDDIGLVINAMIGGVKTQAKFEENGHRNDIRVRLSENDRQVADDILKLFVRNFRGERVPLRDLVEVKTIDTLKSITRKDRERAIGIFANVAPGYSQELALAKVTALSKTLPAGYRIALGGSSETFKESFQSLVFALYLGIIVAYMILGSQYNSFLHPLIVLLALPFSVAGAWFALKVSDQSLNIYSFIGLILLMGIVKKNSILLVDFTNQRRREGLSVKEALLSAAPTRLRPILMTSFATIASAIPPALALGPGSETRVPMAVVVIGGVLVSTFLTLFVVPAAYSLLSPLERTRKVELDATD